MDCSNFSNSSVSVRLRWEEVLALDILKKRTLQPDRDALEGWLYTDHWKFTRQGFRVTRTRFWYKYASWISAGPVAQE
jgi:hypothetical protein